MGGSGMRSDVRVTVGRYANYEAAAEARELLARKGVRAAVIGTIARASGSARPPAPAGWTDGRVIRTGLLLGAVLGLVSGVAVAASTNLVALTTIVLVTGVGGCLGVLLAAWLYVLWTSEAQPESAPLRADEFAVTVALGAAGSAPASARRRDRPASGAPPGRGALTH